MICEATLHVPLFSAYALPLGICLLAALAVAAIWRAPVAEGTSTRSRHIVLGASLALVLTVSAGLIYQARSAHITVQGDTLTASALFVSTTIPLSAIQFDDAVDASTLALPRRKLGTSTGSVQVGRFETETGREVFALRAGAASLRIPVHGKADLVLDRPLYEQIRVCLAARQTP